MNGLLNPPVPAESGETAARKPQRILIVDDEPLIRAFIEASLRAAGYDQLIFSTNGSMVPSLAMSEDPDLIIMDVIMPGGNGLRALRTLQKVPKTAAIPVILTSGFSVPTLEDTTHQSPACLLSKPFTPQQLLERVGRLLNTQAA